MKLNAFLLDEWLEQHESRARYNLGASTGPPWTIRELAALMSDEERDRFYDTPLTYCPGYGHESLRSEIAAMMGVSMDEILVVTGASEALHTLFFLAAGTDANVIVPKPCFPPFVDIPLSFGLEVRGYELRHEDGFQVDIDAVRALCDDNTKLILVNSPHNPTGATLREADWRELQELATSRGIQLVSDEVYHPIYHDGDRRSAAAVIGCTTVGDFSKAFCVPGLRLGYVYEPDPGKLRDYWNVRAHFTISNNMPGELLGEVAVRHRERIFDRARTLVRENLRLVEELFRDHEDVFDWVPPSGGLTVFPRLRAGESARPFCEASAADGVVLVPGDCFGYPEHFRLGLGACPDGFDAAVRILAGVVARRAVP